MSQPCIGNPQLTGGLLVVWNTPMCQSGDAFGPRDESAQGLKAYRPMDRPQLGTPHRLQTSTQESVGSGKVGFTGEASRIILTPDILEFAIVTATTRQEGLAGLRDKSKRPHTSPNAPLKISMYLKRYHDIEISQSGVYRILKRLNMNRLPASQRYKAHAKRWKRYEKQQPGHRIQMDVKFITPLEGSRKLRYHQFIVSGSLIDLRQCSWLRSVDWVRRLLVFTADRLKPASVGAGLLAC